MQKVIAAFEKMPTKRNAEKLVHYVKSHPMCVCLMTREDRDVYKLAQDMLKGGAVLHP